MGAWLDILSRNSLEERLHLTALNTVPFHWQLCAFLLLKELFLYCARVNAHNLLPDGSRR